MTAAGVSLRAARSDTRPSLARLTLVELRKMVDTRSGLWLIVSSVLLTAAVVALFGIFAEARDIDFAGALEVAVAPASVLLPILGVLLMTSEWTQRTAMITFGLVPQRSRVVAAKLAAGVLLALAVMAVCLPAAAIGTAFAAPDVPGIWSLSAELLGRITLSVAISMLMGLAFGALLLNSAAAIVLYFVLPLATAALGSIPPLRGVATWLDPTRALAPLTGETMSGAEWAHAGTALALWLGLPLLVGAWRITRGEIR